MCEHDITLRRSRSGKRLSQPPYYTLLTIKELKFLVPMVPSHKNQGAKTYPAHLTSMFMF